MTVNLAAQRLPESPLQRRLSMGSRLRGPGSVDYVSIDR